MYQKDKNNTIRVRVSDKDLQFIDEYAAKFNVTRSQMVRLLIHNTAELVENYGNRNSDTSYHYD